MKRIQLFLLAGIVVFMASCQTVAEKVSGNYSGTYSANGVPVTSGSGTLTLTPDGDKRVDMVFVSAGNPDITIQDVDITDIFGQYIFNLDNDQGGTIDVDGTIASGFVLALSYDNSVSGVSLSLAGFGKQ